MTDYYEFRSDRPENLTARKVEFKSPEPTPNTAEEVRRQLLVGRTPVLPYEWAQMAETLREREEDQAELSRKLGEAMTQSSETYHDNGPGDAIVNDSAPLVNRAIRVIRKMGSAVLFDYPKPTDDQLTLGSIAEVTFNGDEIAEYLMLIGNRRTLPNFNPGYAAELGEVAFMTIEGVVGNSVLGLVAGDTAKYRLENGRQQSIQIHGIQQVSPELLTLSQSAILL